MVPKKKGFLHGFADGLAQFAGSLQEVVSSAGELLADADLRRKGAQYIVQEASRGINEAQKGLEAGADALGRTIQQGARARLGAGARQLQSVLRNIERQIQEFQRQQQQRDFESEVEHHHKLPVDIQIGDQVFEDMPQEMRSRFWYVLLERPDLARQLLGQSTTQRPCTPSAAASGAGIATGTSCSHNSGDMQCSQHNGGSCQAAPSSSSQQEAGSRSDAAATQAASTQEAGPAAATAASTHASAPMIAEAGPTAAGSPFAPYSRGASPADPILGDAPQAVSVSAGSSSSQTQAVSELPAGPSTAAEGTADATVHSAPACTTITAPAGAAVQPGQAELQAMPCSAGQPSSGAAVSSNAVTEQQSLQHAPEDAASAAVPQAPSPWVSGHNVTSLDPPDMPPDATAPSAAVPSGSEGVSGALAPSPWQAAASSQPAAAAQEPSLAAGLAGQDAAGLSGQGAGPPVGGAVGSSTGASSGLSLRAGESSAVVSLADGEGWEMVSSDVPSVQAGAVAAGADVAAAADQEALNTVRTLVESMYEGATLDEQRATKQAVFQAMLEVPWVTGEGIPDSPLDGTEYAQLLAAGCGAVEEVILRDVPRTFPEHPLFSTPEGQQRLLRVLKAYAAADPEVGYCQGMAFAAGVLLMYLPEEPAFRLYQHIMGPQGPNLRRYYLPGLDHLKLELSCFELVLSSHQPQLHQHLAEAGLPALLYAAQWLMTTYACPFPIHVAARVLDVLLQSDSDAMLPRLGLAVMEALSGKLLELDDFEELITYLKVKPLSWPLHMHRKVFAAALQTVTTDAELQAAIAAAREEFARSGRMSSFSSRHLARQTTGGGTTRHDLVPGPMGPRSQAATEAAAAAAAAAAGASDAAGPASPSVDPAAGQDSSTPAAAGVGSSPTAPSAGAGSATSSSRRASSEVINGVQQPRQLSARQSSVMDAVLVRPASSGIMVDELDALEDLITDLDLLLPGGASETDSNRSTPVPDDPGRPQQQQQFSDSVAEHSSTSTQVPSMPPAS